MEYLAHINRETGRRQTLREHCEHVARLCAQSCKTSGLTHLGYLIGLVHDAGKATAVFFAYLIDPKPGQWGTINHSACGVRLLAEWFGLHERDVAGYTVCLACAAICGHHGGLPDCTTLHGEDGLYKKLFPERETFYEEAARNFTQTCYSREEINSVFQLAEKDVEAFIACLLPFINKLPVSGRKDRMHFIWGMAERFLYSALIDADRHDTWWFQAGSETLQGGEENWPIFFCKSASVSTS